MKRYLLVDYENVQNINLEKLPQKDFLIYIFIGESQNKIPFKLVQDAQKFGDKINWIKIDGNGTNALDFHIAYYLGKFNFESSNDEYIILSKDKGFDPLIRFIKKQNGKCRRINSINEISNQKKDIEDNNSDYNKIIDNLKKINKAKRPRKRNTLIKHIRSLLGKKITEDLLNDLIDELFIKELISEEKSNLKYNF